MLMKFAVFGLILFVPFAYSATPPKPCPSTREYVTSLEYLRSKAILPEPKARELAEQIAVNCSGAAQRFIKTNDVLIKAGIAPANALATALETARGTDAAFETFRRVFQQAFASDSLDLDLASAMKLAQTLAKAPLKAPDATDSDFQRLREDFSSLVGFCLDEQTMNRSRPQCARIAERLIGIGAEKSWRVTPDLKALYAYFGKNKTLDLSAAQKSELALQILSYGPGASGNFKDALDYALSKSGLNATASDAMKFAKKMAELSQKPKTDTATPSRSQADPASEEN